MDKGMKKDERLANMSGGLMACRALSIKHVCVCLCVYAYRCVRVCVREPDRPRAHAFGQ